MILVICISVEQKPKHAKADRVVAESHGWVHSRTDIKTGPRLTAYYDNIEYYTGASLHYIVSCIYNIYHHHIASQRFRKIIPFIEIIHYLIFIFILILTEN